VPETSTVADVVSVLNDIGASPRDIIAILQALKRAGALQADLVIM
jgi:flagellar P-ring protein FlgI